MSSISTLMMKLVTLMGNIPHIMSLLKQPRRNKRSRREELLKELPWEKGQKRAEKAGILCTGEKDGWERRGTLILRKAGKRSAGTARWTD